MEKKVVISLTVMTIVINIFSFLHINQNTVDKLLYDKTTVSFKLYTGKDLSDILLKINEFSKTNNVEIAQYSFLNSSRKDIYSTMKETYNEVLVIPNIFSDKKIKVHNFEELLNVGFKNLLYVNTKNERIMQKLSDELKEDCEIQYSLPNITENTSFIYTNTNSFPVFTLYCFLFILILFFYYSRSRKEFAICRLWGYTYPQTYCTLNRVIYIPLLFPLVLNGLLAGGIIFKFGLSNPLLQVIYGMILLNIITISLLILLSIIIFLFSFTAVDNKRRQIMSKVIITSNILRLFLLFLIFLFINNSVEEKKELDKNLDGLTAWSDTKTLFNLQEIYSPLNYSDLATEDVLNNKILKVYQDLSDLDKVFIISTRNFERSNVADDNYDYTYLYDLENEEDLYSPYGRNIVVDRNYLKRHEIKSVNGKNVVDMIDTDDDVLNILVPQKYKKYEGVIEDSFKDWFYFQRVTVTNMYRIAGNKTEIHKELDDLNINIIYIENNQKYFTYNPYAGDSMNTIEDTIVTVYTENIDNSTLGSYVGSGVFVESEDVDSVLKEISSITEKYGANELNSVASVYDKKGEEIQYLENKMGQLLLNTIIIFLFLIMFMMVITYFYYKLFFRELIIKSLYGYPFIYIYKSLFRTNLLINIGVIPLIVIVYKRLPLYMVVILGGLLLIDYFVVRIVNKYLLTKGEAQFIRGEFK
mgnify:CR=1 FL=1